MQLIALLDERLKVILEIDRYLYGKLSAAKTAYAIVSWNAGALACWPPSQIVRNTSYQPPISIIRQLFLLTLKKTDINHI